MGAIDFTLPYWLLLLPLALLPLLPRKRDVIDFPWSGWIPADSTGSLLKAFWSGFAVLTFVFLIVALAGPGRSELQIERIGRGAELSILMDRSASMDTNVVQVELKAGELPRESHTKNDVVREALSDLINERPENRYSLSLFSVAPIHVAPFGDDPDIVLSGLSASGIGRGPNKTNMGLALVSAIERFDGRSFTGSRAILLVSDGGAKLDEVTREQIRTGLNRNRISLYFIYIQSGVNSPDLETVGIDADAATDEIALHLFFKQLGTEYKVFQADDPDSMAAAVTEIDQLQNLPLSYFEQIPRIDYSRWLYFAALGCCLALAGLTAVKLEQL